MNKKFLIAVCGLCIICLSAFLVFFKSNSSLPQLTREAINNLVASKGENLVWSDFEKYTHKDIGSGNYVYEYPLTDGSKLYLSGTSLSGTPMYIYIVSPQGNRENIVSSK